MEKISSYRDLVVWKKAYQLAQLTYRVTAVFPKEEIYGITSQMRRAAVSIPSNIAEGYRRQHNAEYIQFLSIARGSLAELETQTQLSNDFRYLKQDDFIEIQSLQEEVGKMLFSLINSLKKNHV